MREVIKNAAAMLVLLALAIQAVPMRADDMAGPGLINVETRGVTLPIMAVWNKDAVATLVLYSGGGGGYGAIGGDGWPASANFLIRSAKLFAGHRFNVVMVGRASDVNNLDGRTRIGDRHDQDNQAVLAFIRTKSAAPVWLVGTSMGTISVAAAAIRDGGRNIAGIVLTSSITAYRIPGAVPAQDLEKIRVPVLVVHHERDACRSCTPWEAKAIAGKLKNAPVKKTVLVSGGTGESGNYCEPMHFHGYIGMEKTVVDLIADWVQNPVN